MNMEKPSQDLVNPPLIINDLVGLQRIIKPQEDVTVGRAGSFQIGHDDRYLHRIFFQVWYSGQGWLLKNHSREMGLDIQSRSTRTRSSMYVGPGAIVMIPPGPSAVTFKTPERSYELHFDVPNRHLSRPNQVRIQHNTDSTHARHVPNEDQRQLMEALAAPLLHSPGANDSVIPTIKEVASTLGWTVDKTNRKIERLVKSLEKDGEAVYTPHRNFLAHYAARRHR